MRSRSKFVGLCLGLSLLLLLPGCASNPRRSYARQHRPSAKEEPGYRAKAEEFVRYAQAGDVEQMLKLTSVLSRPVLTSSTRALYRDQVVPAFRDTTVTWSSGSKPELDERNNVGLIFSGKAQGPIETFHFNVAVMKENSALVIINIEGHR